MCEYIYIYIYVSFLKISVGLTENHSNEEMLIIKHFDSEKKFESNRDTQPPVWGVAFTAKEMKRLTAGVLEHMATAGTMIHREPQGKL